MAPSPDLSDVHLLLFLTDRYSLKRWQEIGILDRELALYKHAAPKLDGVTIISYGDEQDQALLPEGNFHLILAQSGLRAPAAIAAQIKAAPWLASKSLLAKNNQVEGGLTALRTCRRLGIPFVARSGYLPTDCGEIATRYTHSSGLSKAVNGTKLFVLGQMEDRLFRGADRFIVTTEEMRQILVQRGGVDASHGTILPNYVDIDRFHPDTRVPLDTPEVLFVGRFESQKNLPALVEAMAGVPAVLHLVGDGSEQPTLAALAQKLGTNIRFTKRLPQEQLPSLMASASVFALPSHNEGNPKVLVEAMAAGAAIVGSDRPGIGNLLRHEDTGILTETDPDSIKRGIQRVLDSQDLSDSLRHNARSWAEERVGLPSIVERELAVYAKTIGKS
jgi:glycosyltransferase involved in cell wall biosynthesis